MTRATSPMALRSRARMKRLAKFGRSQGSWTPPIGLGADPMSIRGRFFAPNLERSRVNLECSRLGIRAKPQSPRSLWYSLAGSAGIRLGEWLCTHSPAESAFGWADVLDERNPPRSSSPCAGADSLGPAASKGSSGICPRLCAAEFHAPAQTDADADTLRRTELDRRRCRFTRPGGVQREQWNLSAALRGRIPRSRSNGCGRQELNLHGV